MPTEQLEAQLKHEFIRAAHTSDTPTDAPRTGDPSAPPSDSPAKSIGTNRRRKPQPYHRPTSAAMAETPSDPRVMIDAMTPEDRERVIARRLRVIALALLVLAAIAIAISRVPVTILSDRGPRPEHSGINDLLLVYLAVLFGPGGSVALWPRRWAIAFWAVWVVPVSLFALFLAHLGEMPRDHPHPDPAWPGTAITWLLLAIHAGIVVVIPVVRGTHRSPAPGGPSVPVAQVHSR